MNPAISILMPVRNDAETLRKCLLDISRQSFSDFEAVIVNDGSNDETRMILEKEQQADSRIKLIHTPARGIVEALNTGLQECQGKYIARMDADDRMLPYRLEEQMKMMSENPELDLIGCCVEGFTDTGPLPQSGLDYQSWSNSLLTHEQMVRDMFAESTIMHPTFFGKRELFAQLGYSEHPWAEDYDFILRAYISGARLGKHEKILVHKYHAPGRLSRTDSMYKRPAMFDAKVHYLLESGLLEKREGVMIVGSGPTGRQAAESFVKKGVTVLGFVDNRTGPPNRKVKCWPAWGFPELPTAEFLETHQNAFFVLAIGNAEGQSEFMKLLTKNAFCETRDFVRFIYNWPHPDLPIE